MHTRNTLIMAVVFVLLAGFVYVYEIRGRAEREEEERRAELLLSFAPEDVVGLRIVNDDETVVARKQDGSWSIAEPRPVPADGEALDTLVDNLHNASHERLVTEAPEDLAPFGLAEAPIRVTVELADGSEQTLEVGNDTPVGFNLYATAGSGVYSAPRALRNQVGKRLIDLRDRTVLAFDEAAVRRLRIERPEYTADLSYDPAAGESGRWSLTEPTTGLADGETITDIVAEVHGAEAEDYVLDAAPDEAGRAEYGLDRPWMTLALWTEGSEAPLRLLVGGESSEPAGRYAMREGGDEVLVIDPVTLADVPAALDGLRNRQVVDFARERAQALELTRDGETVRLEKDATDWRLVAPLELAADASTVSRLLSGLQDLRAEGFADAATATDGLRLTVELEPAAEGGDREPIRLAVGNATRSVVPLSADAEEPEEVEVRAVESGSGTVFWVPAEDVATLEVDLFELRDKTLVEFTQGELTELELSTADGSAWTLVQADEAWSLQGDGEIDPTTVDDLLWELNYLRMEGVLAESAAAAELDAWGLEPAGYRIVARTAEAVAVELSLGGERSATDGDDDRVAVLVAGHPGVYEVGVGLLDAVRDLVESLRQ